MGVKGTYIYDYERPMLTADCAVVNPRGELLLVRRGGEPFKGCWALPGGFMEMDEAIEQCAVRELNEETGLVVDLADLRRVGGFSAPGRDPRGRTVTVAYAVHLAAPVTATAADDAAEVRWWSLDELPPMAFDHNEIVKDAYTTAI